MNDKSRQVQRRPGIYPECDVDGCGDPVQYEIGLKSRIVFKLCRFHVEPGRDKLDEFTVEYLKLEQKMHKELRSAIRGLPLRKGMEQ